MYQVNRMEVSQWEEEIKKLSKFLSEMQIAHYIYSFALHIPGKITYVSLDNPMEIRIKQNKRMEVRVLKTMTKEGGEVKIETWKDFDSVVLNIESSNVEVVYHNGELEILFLF